jgi:GNAT superfamily N-acetyltransferase
MRIFEITEDKEIKTKKNSDGFTLDLIVDGDHVGQYTHSREDDIVRNYAEIFPEYRNKGHGSMLLLAAIKTADDMGIDFEEDTQSLTPAMSRLYDELDDSGMIYGGNGSWAISPSGENELEDWLLEVTENFADGKKKGKSRPGRVKRSGASCNGSVTDLRAKAKKASGEKAKMYHWCANMKSGKKKK